MDVQLLEQQYNFITSEAKKALLLSGIGYGKTFSGAHFVIKMVSEYPNVDGLLTANTFQQLSNATVATLVGELDNANISHKLVSSGAKKRIEILGSKIYLYSLENFNNIRGIEVGWWLSDETAFSKLEAVQVCRGRIRQKNAPLYERHTSSPNGYNFLYDEFENKDGDNITDKIALYRGKTKENIFLPKGYYEDLLEDYGGTDNPLAKQELEGQFVNLLAGAIYWAFDRGKHVAKAKPNKDFIVDIGQDFNIDNMCGCYVQRINGHYFVFQENVLENYGANTDNAASKIVVDLKGYAKRVIPDSTGKARKTSSSGKTDIQILESYGLEVMSTRNPFIRDRQNTLNILFKKNKITIDPSCKVLLKELETLSSRDKEGDKAHVAVALGYVAWKFDPLKRDSKNRVSIGSI
jgi:phage terminase large subunit-like protein